MMRCAVFLFLLPAVSAVEKPRRRATEIWTKEQVEAKGIAFRGNSSSQSSHDMLQATELPAEYTWCDVDGKSYCTMSRNQHIPQYCGSCWAHGAVSALADRVKIARKAQGADINPSVQHLLNCGDVGSCHGGSVDGPYQWLHQISKETGTGISYETAQPYMACSSESKEGLCPSGDWTCKPANVARTCSTFPPEGFCAGLDRYPNITISEYGSISGADAMMKEIYNRGPISCGIDADPLRTYTTGIVTDKGEMTDHVISVVGWGVDKEHGTYWKVRNSWGEYWGELGYVRVKQGALQIEEQCSWAVVSGYSGIGDGSHCYEDGTNCKASGPSPSPSPSPSPGPSPGKCADKHSFCTDSSIFEAKTECKWMATFCKKTCGCCGANPPSECQSAVDAEKLEQKLQTAEQLIV